MHPAFNTAWLYFHMDFARCSLVLRKLVQHTQTHIYRTNPWKTIRSLKTLFPKSEAFCSVLCCGGRLEWDVCGRRPDTKGSEDTLSFSLSPRDSRVSCLSQRVEVVLVLSFLQARWGSTAALCCSGLKKNICFSRTEPPPGGGVYPQHFINIRWSHCLFGFQGKKKKSPHLVEPLFCVLGSDFEGFVRILNFICSAVTFMVNLLCSLSILGQSADTYDLLQNI